MGRETSMNAAQSFLSHSESGDDSFSASPRQQKAQQTRTPPTAQSKPSMGMSPMSRYNHNLKVLRRRDPSIISIFDQFSHVCVYHHNGKKWEKQGYEGSMFLYERDSYPPYGFYILNRMGMEDYIHRLYPEDDIGAHGSYLMLRSYPDFTAKRLAAIYSSHDSPPDKLSTEYVIPDLDKLTQADKGKSQVVGLWMFTTDSREPMIDVMIRLHSHIKKNEAYPEEFRYGPDKPPPPNTASRKSGEVGTKVITRGQNLDSSSESGDNTPFQSVQSPPENGLSDLDKLFLKLSTNSVSALPTTSTNSSAPPTSGMTVDSLFAALSGPSSSAQPTPTHNNPNILPAQTTSNKTASLLNSIFASATPPPSNGHLSIYSPTPTTSTAPHVLSQDVLSNLLGLPHSRSASVASMSSNRSSNTTSARSHSSSREGDDEEESNDDAASMITSASERAPKRHGNTNGAYSDGGYSESSTVLDDQAESGPELQPTTASAVHPLLTEAAEGLLRGSDRSLRGTYGHGRGGVTGDVTPRPPVPRGSTTNVHPSIPRMNSTSRLQSSQRIYRGDKAEGRVSVPPPATVAPPVEFTSSTSTVRGSMSQSFQFPQQRGHRTSTSGSSTHSNGTLNHRPLVPFSADSELWPYSQASPALSNSKDEPGEGEILELDFEETSALSDMNAFKKALEKGKERSRGKLNTSAGSSVDLQYGSDLGINGNARRKTRKEREAERIQREREQIENSWDTPVPVSNPPSSIPLDMSINSVSNPRSPTPSSKKNVAVINGTQPQVHRQAVNNGGVTTAVDSNLVKDHLIGALLCRPQKPGRLERNTFVREVLTLIHTDKTFVDDLWKDYMDRLDG
ncbi:hypothetical protein AMATHDRAFT_63340 [Amanita thiersii Skay4041]|uniref:mRNA-decapping enzyme C-terminal domain-containing protein n=1 Tax=Amanita thiersii Skay4041 TaxID=703135 RepID=A0A2A9NEE7_9AGAR|nr:hypothetical protein AMATHDRAFT_63340 [Amanita thiersii Skay4041]